MEEQRGFKYGRGCIRCIKDQIFVLKQLLDKCREKRKELHTAFIDLEKSYDKVCREALKGCCMNVELMGT